MSDFVWGIVVGYVLRGLIHAFVEIRNKARREAAAKIAEAKVWAQAEQLRVQIVKDFTEGDGR